MHTKILKTNQLFSFNINDKLNCCRIGLLTIKIENMENVVISRRLYKDWDYNFFILKDGIYLSESSNCQHLDDVLDFPPFKIFSFN